MNWQLGRFELPRGERDRRRAASQIAAMTNRHDFERLGVVAMVVTGGGLSAVSALRRSIKNRKHAHGLSERNATRCKVDPSLAGRASLLRRNASLPSRVVGFLQKPITTVRAIQATLGIARMPWLFFLAVDAGYEDHLGGPFLRRLVGGNRRAIDHRHNRNAEDLCQFQGNISIRTGIAAFITRNGALIAANFLTQLLLGEALCSTSFYEVSAHGA